MPNNWVFHPRGLFVKPVHLPMLLRRDIVHIVDGQEWIETQFIKVGEGPFWWLWLMADYLGIHRAIERATGKPCGCTKRRDRLTTRWERFRKWVAFAVSF